MTVAQGLGIAILFIMLLGPLGLLVYAHLMKIEEYFKMVLWIVLFSFVGVILISTALKLIGLV